MLKILPTFDFENKIQRKCAEIFYHNFNNFTIFCTLCEVKLFQFEDFILHLQNVHLKNNSLKIEDEINEGDYTVQNVHLESSLLKTEDDINEDDFAETDEELESFDEEEEIRKVLKDTPVKHKKKSEDKEEVCVKRSRSKANIQDKEVRLNIK
ncbi:hypothetical protein DOY81_001919 [Sarcophaga bullata]|nr:hypothetical protein DOY81_001919 [Sarcophaga bullata]